MADNKDKKVLNVPALRFPEFTEEWETVKIGTITKKVGSGVTPRGGESVYRSKGHPFVRSQNIGWGRLLLNDIAYIDEETHKKQLNTALELNDVLLNITGASIGRCAVVNEMIVNGNVNQHVCIIRSNGAVDSEFLCNYLLSNYGQKQIDSFQAGGNRQGLNFEQIKSIRISIPTLDEQKHIAKLLCAINQRIETQNKIIEKYESLIQAIIYKAKIDGISKGTWRRIELCKVLQERNEKNVDGRTICSVSVSQGVVNQIEYLGRSFAAKQTGHYNVVKYGDIVYTKSPTGDFPYGIIKRSDIQDDVAVSPLYGVYIPASDSIGVILHYYFMRPSNAFNYLHPLIQKGAKNTINITNGRFLENSVPLPISKSEANTIAGILKTIQEKIEIEKSLSQSYTKEKEYLLRQMFI